MDISVLDKDFTPIAIIDSYKSFIWTDRYDRPGDFEIYTVASTEIQQILKKDYYIQILDSEHTMIIEDFTVETNAEDGNFIKIVGRSLESILDRRIVWKMTDIDGLLTSGIYKLLNDAIINPEIADRKISNFIIEDTSDTAITSLKMDHQYTGDNLLDIVMDMCEANDIGFKITLNDNNQFVFKLYKGIDRSYAQDDNSWVVFMPSFDNVINTTYTETNSGYKNVTLVAGEDRQYDVDTEYETLSMDEKEALRVTRTVGSGTGLYRRELYTDARDIQKEEEMSEEEYNLKLDQRGTEKLQEASIKKQFDGQYETERMFVYGVDFFMGDVVQVANEFGNEAPSRIIEFIWSHSESGTESYPTFKAYDYQED